MKVAASPLYINSLPLEGKVPAGADRAQAAGKTDEESRKVRGTCGGNVSLSLRMTKISRFSRNDDTGIY